MRRGGGKAKGSAFERRVCKELSLWVTAGKNEDVFWRSAMSGGRATVAHKRGAKLSRQAGDISAVAPEGHALTDKFYIEVKHVKSLDLLQFYAKGTGHLAKFWKVAKREAKRHGRRPLIIARQNNLPTVIICKDRDNSLIRNPTFDSLNRGCLSWRDVQVWRWDDVLATPFFRCTYLD